MLGLFDSGLGGLTVLRRLHEQLPKHDIMFFADQAHVPYGDRSSEDLLQLLTRNLAFMKGADAVVMACNTSCAIASEYGWPPSAAPIVDLIESAALAVEQGGYKRLGVVATAATARSGAYKRKIGQLVPDAEVSEVAAPALVPLVEAGKLEGAEPRAAVEEVCRKLPPDLDAVILACTHYPLLDEHFATALGPGVTRIDPAIVHVQRTVELADAHGFKSGTGRIRCITNADLARFKQQVSAILGTFSGDIIFERQA